MPKLQALESGAGHRRSRGRRVSTVLAEINVVPLVDVMLVLLIIFMVAAPMMQRGFDVNLPVARRAEPKEGERIFVNVPLAYRTNKIVYIGDKAVRIEVLTERVRQELLTNPTKDVFLRGDGAVQLQELMDVMDRLKDAGVQKVGIVAKLPGGALTVTMDAVSPILVDRAREPQGLRMTVVVSLVVHGVVALILLFGPPLVPIDTTPHTVMTISLGPAATGAKTGGATSMAGATTQKAEANEKPSPAPPPAERPEMTVPKSFTKTPPPKATAKILQDEKPRALPKAAQASTGDARIQTSSRTQGFGLSSGGVGSGGFLDVQNFCCPEYLSTVFELVRRNWNADQQVVGETLIKFTITRDGRITSVQRERSSGYFALDQSAERALLATNKLPPLPAQFPDPTLTVHLTFQYVTH